MVIEKLAETISLENTMAMNLRLAGKFFSQFLILSGF
jgi:hypothetical protein